MDKRKIATAASTIALVVSLFAVPAVGAQTNENPGSAGDTSVQTNIVPPNTNNVDQNTGTDINTANPANPGVAGTTDTNAPGVDWRWLLPLLAIPVLYIIWKMSTEPEDRTYESHSRYAMGAKGGRSRREERDRDLDEEDRI